MIITVIHILHIRYGNIVQCWFVPAVPAQKEVNTYREKAGKKKLFQYVIETGIILVWRLYDGVDDDA